MTKNITREMKARADIQRLMREKRMLAIQREGLILLSLSLAMVLGVILIAI